MKVIYLFSFVLISFLSLGQSVISVSVEAGLGPKAKNVFDSGYVNPKHQNVRLGAFSLSVNDFKNFGGIIYLGVTLRNSISFTADGWANFNDLVTGSDLPQTGKKFLPGSYDFYTLKSSLQCNIGTPIILNGKGEIRVVYSPETAIYWPITDYRVNSQVFNPSTGFVYTLYDGLKDFKMGKMAYTRAAFKFEHSFSVNSKFRVFKRNYFGIDFYYHLGIKNLEETHLVFYPDLPQFRAKIHYSQNNNFCSMALRYYFEKSKRKT